MRDLPFFEGTKRKKGSRGARLTAQKTSYMKGFAMRVTDCNLQPGRLEIVAWVGHRRIVGDASC